MSEKPNAVGIFHVNLNCTNLEKSVRFYQLIGFKTVNDFDEPQAASSKTFGEIGLPPILRVPDDCEARAKLLMLGDDRHATRLDLIEWTNPQTTGSIPGDLTTVGVQRICLRVRDAWKMHTQLVEAGYPAFSPPTLIDMGGTRQLVFCCADPDGFAIEFMEFQGKT